MGLLFLFIGADTVEVGGNAGKDFQIILNILRIGEGIFRQQDGQLRLFPGGGAQGFAVIRKRSAVSCLLQGLFELIQGQPVADRKIFRMKILQGGQDIFCKSGCNPGLVCRIDAQIGAVLCDSICGRIL